MDQSISDPGPNTAASVDTRSHTSPSNPSPSPFLQPPPLTTSSSLAILHLRRDQSIPTILGLHDDQDQGYSEGKVTNTRFGSFPHSTLIGLPWGSQVRASAVDTGSRGRRGNAGLKRKREDGAGASGAGTPVEGNGEGEDGTGIARDAGTPAPKAAVVAQSGFVHILPPTPEVWTMSLPHRTQVVYTPDYSFVLQRLRALPGTQMIEAGAGSGSFSHAAVRSVFSGYPNGTYGDKRRGKVWSFEFHEKRCETLKTEVKQHGLEGLVEVNHRDVYEGGFTVVSDGKQMVQATAVFLDLPAPWMALHHLTRKGKASGTTNGASAESADPANEESKATSPATHPGPLSSTNPVHLCCFLPCIEQVQRTVQTLKSLSWLEIAVVEVAARRIEVRRERVGIREEGLRGVNASPANVEEALVELREAEVRTKVFHESSAAAQKRRAREKQREKGSEDGPDGDGDGDGDGDVGANGEEEGKETKERPKLRSKQERLQEIKEESERRKLYKEGRLVHRPEPELKTHTSYLIFAVLPREWTQEDEELAQKKWASGGGD